MKDLKTYRLFEGIAMTDSTLPKIDRTKELSEDEFLKILDESCKNFSINNDELWRSKGKKFDLNYSLPIIETQIHSHFLTFSMI